MNNDNQPRFGFVNFAETWNGRMAMMGILIGLGTELITGQSILSLGVRFQAYGFIGGFLVLTLWVWLLGVILYFGQCWSVVIANMTLVNKKRNYR